ncbi:MAG: hypothetical protein ACE5EE_06990 [Fidelibacterota bacterium]
MILIYLLTGFSFVTLLLTGIQGFLGFFILGINHATFGFFTAIIYLLTEVLVMFFFVGMGVSIKEYLLEQAGDPAFHKKSIAIKRKLYPPTLTNVLLIMTVFIIGGGVDTGSIPAWIHGILFLLALYHFATTIRTQHHCFKENTDLILEMTGAATGETPD